MQDSIQALAEVVSQDILKSLQASPFFALCIDETTDVTITKQLIVCWLYWEVRTASCRSPNYLMV